MFVVEVLMTAFNNDGGVKEQDRNTRYFDNIDDAMLEYANHYSFFTEIARDTIEWNVFVISIFGGSELLKMETIRPKKE